MNHRSGFVSDWLAGEGTMLVAIETFEQLLSCFSIARVYVLVRVAGSAAKHSVPVI